MKMVEHNNDTSELATFVRLYRILRVAMEVPLDACERLYEGAPHCAEILVAMTALGFTLAYNGTCDDRGSNISASDCAELGHFSEYDWEFVRPGIMPLYYGV